MKKKRSILLIIFTFILLSLTISIKADSGWDGSYDSGGSSWDSGSSWDGGSSWSGGSSWDRPSRSSNTTFGFEEFLWLIVFIVIIILVITQTNKDKNNNYLKNDINFDINKIKEVLPDFNEEIFRKTTFEIYKNIQIAWMNFDYDTLEKYTTNELYNLYKSELMALSVKKQKNVMKDFSLLDFKITNMEKGLENVSIKVNMRVKCKDYVTDQADKIVRGDTRYVLYNYEMTFTKGLSLKDNKCPNCNAPLVNAQTTTCPYCDSTVINNNHDWVLSKKQLISQTKIN